MRNKLNNLKSRINEHIKGTGMVGAPTAKELIGFTDKLMNKFEDAKKAFEELENAMLVYDRIPTETTKIVVDAKRLELHRIMEE
jgi:hypothetical protein